MANKAPAQQIIEQPFRLTDSDPVIVKADGVAGTWTDIFSYQVPNGVALILKPNHTFAAYLEDVGAEADDFTCQVKIEKRDSSQSDVLLAYGPEIYITTKEFQDTNLMARLKVPGDGMIINQREFLVVSVKYANSILYAASYFEMHIAKVRKAIGT